MKKMLVIKPEEISDRLQTIMDTSLCGYNYEIISDLDCETNLKNKLILFVVELNDSGINLGLYKMLQIIKRSYNCMIGSIGKIIINSSNEFYTRSVARQVILYANEAGCLFPGRPLLEATGSLKNFTTQKKVYPKDTEYLTICLQEARKTVEMLVDFKLEKIQSPKILVLHASSSKTSNTLTLWNMVKSKLKNENIQEIHIENGSIRDCRGCKYKMCKHYAETTNCFYGGVMAEEIYPAIIECDIMILLCPNYNDAISANISAAINRLTALFRKIKFYNKYIFSVIVSGHSGSDLLAEQLISALNINKTFMLPPKFALMETANDPGSIINNEGIYDRAESFANNINSIGSYEI